MTLSMRNSFNCLWRVKVCKVSWAKNVLKILWLNLIHLNLIDFCYLKLGVVKHKKFTTAGGHKVFLSGGSPGKRRVGIGIATKLLDKINDVLFFSYSDRVRTLHFTLGTIRFQFGLLLSCCANNGNVLIFGGDFNAVLGSSLEGDDVEFLGTSGLGDRNDRGSNGCTLDSAKWFVSAKLDEGVCIVPKIQETDQ